MNRRIYNPFIKIEKYANEELVIESEKINGKRMEIGSIWIEEKIGFQDLMIVFRKLNFYYGMIIALKKGLESDTPLETANRSFMKYISAVLDGYKLGFRTTALHSVPCKNGRNRKQLLKDVPRSSIIFTRRKDGEEHNVLHYFRVNKDETNMKEVFKNCESLIKTGRNKCKSLLIKKKVLKGTGLWNVNGVFGALLINLKDIENLLEEYRIRGLDLKFDIISYTKDMIEMVNGTLEFHFKRRWVLYPTRQKNPKKLPLKKKTLRGPKGNNPKGGKHVTKAISSK